MKPKDQNLKQEKPFNSDVVFNKELTRIFATLINEKLSDFLDYCILTKNAEPLKEVIYVISTNQFEK